MRGATGSAGFLAGSSPRRLNAASVTSCRLVAAAVRANAVASQPWVLGSMAEERPPRASSPRRALAGWKAGAPSKTRRDSAIETSAFRSRSGSSSGYVGTSLMKQQLHLDDFCKSRTYHGFIAAPQSPVASIRSEAPLGAPAF